MSTGEDEPSPSVNGRLRPRKSTSTTTPSPQNKINRRPESKLAQDRPKRTSTPSKASPAKQDDLVTQSDAAPAPLLLCPYCERKFNTRQTASKHARRIHLSTSKQDNFIKCLYCNHSDAESNGIIKHMVDSHPNQYFACLDCHTRFPSTTELAEHKHNVCEKQKPTYRSKLRQNTSPRFKKNQKKSIKGEKTANCNESTQLDNLSFNGIVISCELKPSDMHDETDIEDKITTNLILPSTKTLGNTAVEKNAVIVLDDLQWNKRIPPNFSFHNSDADQILSRLGVVHRSPRVGESRKDLIRMMDEPNEKFEKCFDTSFYSKVAKNVQENLAKYLDGTFNFNPNKDTTIKTRKSKASVMINTAEGFPILLAHEQFSRHLFDGFIARTVAPKHKWKWDTAENDKNLVMLLDQTKRDSHVNNCIITFISSLDIWTQLRMKSKFEDIFKTTPTAKKTEKQNIISMELKEILESRDIPSSSSQVVQYKRKPAESGAGSELPAYLGLSATSGVCELQPAVLSGEWVRPRCYVCCACGDQTRDARTLSSHLATRHPNAQVQHYEIVGETLLSADILKHLYVPPSQMSNRTRPPRGFRDCTKCKKSVTLEELHQHMLDCAGDTPTVRRKCRYRPFGVRRRRPRLPDNTIRKKMRKDIRSRHRQKAHMRPRPKTRTEVGDAETIRKMIADLPAKRNRITPTNVLRPRRTAVKTKKQVKHRSSEDKQSKHRPAKSLNKTNKTDAAKKQNDTDNSSTIDEDDQPLKLSATRVLTRADNGKEVLRRRSTINKTKKKKQSNKQDTDMQGLLPNYHTYNTPPYEFDSKILDQNMYNHDGLKLLPINMSRSNVLRPTALRPDGYPPGSTYCFPHQQAIESETYNQSAFQQIHQETINADLTDRIPQYQSALESSQQWIDVKNAGPSNIRQYSSRDDNNMQNSKDHSVRGGDGSNQNNNIAQAPNMPLKHSIASLTSETDDRDASMPNQPVNHSYLLPSEINRTFVYESADSRKIFENEVTVDKVDKPPLSNNPTQCQKSNEKQPVGYNPIESDSLSAYTPSPCDPIKFENPMVPSRLPNESVESRAASKQMFLQDLVGLHGQLPLLDKFQSNQIVEQSPILKDSKELSELNQDHKIAHLITETKIETDKTKSTKTRKGLNDCIAMLRTKKGLRLDRITTEHGDDENMDSEVIDLETVDSEVPTIGGLDQTLSGSKISEEKAKKSINMPPTHSSSGQEDVFSAHRNQRLSTDHLPVETDGTVQQKKVRMDSEHPSLHPKKQEEEFNETRSSYGTKSSKLSLVGDAQKVPSPDESVLSKHSNDDNTDLTIIHNMRRNSHVEIQTREEPKLLLNRSKVSQKIQKLIDLNVPNLTKTMREVQATLIKNKKKEEDIKVMHDFSNRVENEVEKQRRTPEPASKIDEAVQKSEQVELTVKTAAQAFSQIALSIDDSIDAKMPFPQSNVSPTSRRTRRKPIKTKANLIPEQIPHSEQSIPQRQKVVSPLHHDSRTVGTSPIDLNMQPYNSSYLPAVSTSHETLPINPPPPNPIHVRRESCKRVLDCSETSAADVENRDHLSLTNTVGTSPETYPESIMNMHNLRRHSIELVNSQTINANYDKLMAYRNQYEKALMSISLTSRGVSHPHNINRDDCISDDSRYDKPNELHSRYAPNSTFVSMTHDTHGIMHVNPNALSSSVNMSNTRDIQENYRTTQENDQLMNVHRQRSDNLEAKRGHSMKIGEHVDKYFIQESKAIKESSALDTNSHLPTARRTSEVYYNRSSPYRRNGPNMNTLDHFVDMGFDKNKETHDNALRAYHESVASFAVPTATYSNNIMHMQHNAISLIPSLSCEPNVDDMAPLDLSCDTKSRKDQTLDLSKKSTDVLKNLCNIPISNEKHSDDVALNPILFRRNYTGESQSLPQRSLLSSETEHVEELAHQLAPNVALEKSGKNKIDVISQEFTYQQALTSSIQSANVDNSELLDRSLNNSNKHIHYDDETTKLTNTSNVNNYSIDQLQSLQPECNYSISHDSQILNSKEVYLKESQQEKTFLQNKKIIRPAVHVNPEVKFEDEPSKNITPCAPLNTDNQNAENNDPHGWDPHPYVDHHMTSPNVPNANDMKSQNNSTLEIKSKEKNAQICDHEVFPENDNGQIEQDAETARKIAMLPEELVKILGTIPKDHRNQLLNVLPQYVSTPQSNVENDTKNTLSSANVQKKYELRADTKHNISGSSDSNRLSVNTAITSSSVIPKKRHSPSHSRGRLNSSESQSAGPMMPPSFAPTLSQSSPIGHIESANNLKFLQTSSFIKTNYSENLVNPTHKTAEQDWTDIKLTDDSSKPAHLNKNNEDPASDGTAFPSATVSQEVTLKLPIKQKPSNEKTASLRAVRIKTTSTKKSFSDDKQLMGNYCYKTIVKADEKCSNAGQITSPSRQACNISPTDLKYEINKSSIQQTENKSDNYVILWDTIKQNTDYFQDRSKTIETEIISQTKEENNDNCTHNEPHHTRLSQNECNITPQDIDLSKNTITLERPSSLPLQETNKDVDHFLEQMKSTSLPKGGIPEDEVFALEPKIVSPENESKKELVNTNAIQFDSNKNDFTPEIMIPEETINTTESKILEQCSDDNKEVQPLSSTSTKNHDAKQDKELDDEESKKSLVVSLELEIKTGHKVPTKNEKLNEDDSEDDVTLAVIKQKNCKADYKIRKITTKPSRLKSKDNRSKLKVASKRPKKKLSKSLEITQSNKLSDDFASKTIFIQPDDNREIRFIDDKCKNIANMLPITTAIDKVKNNIKINDDDVIPACPNEIVNSFDSDNKIEQKGTSDTNINLQPEKSIKSGSEPIQDLPNLNVLRIVEFDSTYVSLDESQSKLKETNKTKNEIKCNLSNVDRNNELGLLSSVLNKTKTDKKNVKDFTEASKKDSTKITPFATPIDSIPSDFQLCSEMIEVNTLPLRRSRRGKSMYVDSSYLEDSEQIEDRTKKAPLTMKRLILSRVEKDKKRISESSTLEKSDDATDDSLAITSEEPEFPCVKREKQTKSKKSPQSRKISKKTKSINTNDVDEEPSELSELSNLYSTSENNSCILRELPNAENKIAEIDSCNDDLKCRTISDNNSSLSENTTTASNEKESDVAGDSLLEIKETTSSVKRKLNTNKSIDLISSKSKKTKYHKKKSQSDFDSDDDKVLLETKQKIANEKHLVDDHNCSNISKEEEDNNGKSPKNDNEANNDIYKQTANASASASETRVTCYSRSIPSRKPRSSSTSLKDHANYDPYDIDFIDILETSGPIIKKKGKTSNNKQSAILHIDHNLNVPREVIDVSPYKDSKQTVTKIQPNMNNESDSDSSKSDVPLQTYVDNKISKVDSKNKNNKNSNESTESTENSQKSNQKCLDNEQTLITENDDYNNVEKPYSNISNVEVTPTFKSKKSTKRATTDDSICESDTPFKDESQNPNSNISVDQTTEKLSNKQKKTRRAPAVNDVDSAIVSNEDDQQLRSDKFMENFGFYSERIPRKSNLLASKKISETYHLIGDEKDDSFCCHKEKSSRKSASNENKKKSETGSNIIASLDSTTTGDVLNLDVPPSEPRINTNPNESGDVSGDVVRTDDSDLDSLTAQAIMDSEEVRALENDLFSSLREAAEASARNSFVGYQNTSDLDMTPKDVDQKDSISPAEDKIAENLEPTKKPNKTKQNKQPGVKDKMYPDIDEIDMFEDKFDKIKRKRRSQAVAAKQVQVVAESNTSAKSRKQSERKRTTKSTKKTQNYQSTQVPTKGALKGFEGIKISIPTQDLNMPINVSPPRQSKKRRKTNVKKRKEISYLDSSCSDFDDKDKSGLERDIYEFKESEDTELFDLRPSTVMDRFRSMHNKSKSKHKEKDKSKDTEKEKLRSREKERKSETKVSTNFETVKERNKNTTSQNEKRRKNSFSREEGQGSEKGIRREANCGENNLEIQKDSHTPNYCEVNNGKKEVDSAIASTSGFIPERIDESDYESEMSSPEGDFIFYMSNDINCVCPSDNDSDDSDVERACGRLNCVNKNRNADKNAAIENIFKNNAVRCEKPDTKDPEKPRPNLDQLFDSLLETESKPIKNVNCVGQKDVTETSNIDLQKNIITSLAHVSQHNLTESKGANDKSRLKEDIISIFDESNNKTDSHQSLPTNSKYESNNTITDEHTPRKSVCTSSLCQNDILTDSNSMQIFSIDDKQKESIGYSLMSEESTQVNFSDIIAHDTAMKNETNDNKISNIKSTKTDACHITNYNSEDEFDIDKPETLNRQFMHLILPAEKVSTCVQTDNKIDYSDVESCNELAATKYLKGLLPSADGNLEIYKMVSAQGTQTDKSKRHESESSKNDDFSQSQSEDEINLRVMPRSRIRLQKYDVHENSHKSKSTMCIQTEKNKDYKSSQYDAQTDSDDDVETDKCDRTEKELDLDKGNIKSYRVSNSLDETPPYDVDAFTAPASRFAAEKHSPRKSDEGISTSHDYSADAFDLSLDNAGVARQRARRKCAVGKQNVLAEHWSSESEFDGAPPRPNSADSVVASAPRKKKSRKKEGHYAGGRKASRHLAKSDSKSARGRVAIGGRSEEGDACASGSGTRVPRGPKMRARAAHYWSSEGEELAGPQPQHGWIVGDSHKKLVTMLAHAKGRKRNYADRHLD